MKKKNSIIRYMDMWRHLSYNFIRKKKYSRQKRSAIFGVYFKVYETWKRYNHLSSEILYNFNY